MTLKAIDILHKRNPEKGFFLMSEAASIDKVRCPPSTFLSSLLIECCR
jgi:hypothetical protein